MRRIILSLILFLSILNLSLAQNDSVKIEKSKDKVIIGGQAYYVHIVKKGETLFSLSVVYEVSQKDIAKENPDIFLGLQIGQALKVPIGSADNEKDAKNKDVFIYHKVKKNHTLYSLSKKYNVSQDDIIACNPSAKYGINIDQIIKIPKSKDVVEAIQNFPISEVHKDTIKITVNFIYHTVIAKETEYSLTRLYEISSAVLYEYNPIARDGIKIGQVLKIPKVLDPGFETVLYKTEPSLSDSVEYEKRAILAYSDSVDMPECDKIRKLPKEPFQVAVFLPFYLDKNDEEFYIDSSEFNEKGKRKYEKVYYDPFYIYPKSLSYIEFYEGLLLAIDTLKQKGFSVNLHVYDTRNDTSRIKEILGFPELKRMDLIIGPIYNHELKLVSSFSKEHRIKVVSPLSDDLTLVDENPYFFQVYPSNNAQIEEFAKYVSGFRDKNIILVHNGDSLKYANIQLVKDRLFRYLSMDTLINNIQFKEVAFRDSIKVLEHALVNDKQNIFIVPSNEEAFVTNVITNLNTLKSFKHDLSVIGFSRWQRFSNIDPEYFFNLNLAISTPFFIDYSNLDVKRFVLKYREAYHTEPNDYAIHGYDVGLYFLSALMSYGKSFEACVYNHQIDLLQANYKFVKWYETSGYENIDVGIIKYLNDYNITRIKNPENKLEQFSQVK